MELMQCGNGKKQFQNEIYQSRILLSICPEGTDTMKTGYTPISIKVALGFGH